MIPFGMLKISNLNADDIQKMIPGYPVMVCYRGSVSHGTYVPKDDPESIDDIDIMAAWISPMIESYFGVRGPYNGLDVKVREYDTASYEISHFVKLLLASNPNVLSTLWMDSYIHLSREGEALIKSRDLFSSKRAGATFTGYMWSQIRRMTSFHDSGESACCEGGEFHTAQCKLTLERGRGSSKRFATGYMGAKRKASVMKLGFDAKNAAHAIRLGRMGIEFLRDGKMYVNRELIDAEEIKAIKRGEWSLEKIKAEADRLMGELQGARDASKLPDEPDEVGANRILSMILSKHWRDKTVDLAEAFDKCY